MKTILIFILAHLFFYTTYSQTVVGIWQANTPSVSSTFLNTYQFFPDSTFKFNTNGFDGLHRIISIGGNYLVANDQIVFTVRYTIEIVGGSIERDELSTSSDTWALLGGKTEQIPLETPVIHQAEFWLGATQPGILSLSIDSRKYYKVDANPYNLK